MKLDVYDTWVQTTDGNILHFDVLMPKNTDGAAVEYAKHWLQKMNISFNELKQENCRFCHSEIPGPEVEQQVKQLGYFILQMEGCPSPV